MASAYDLIDLSHTIENGMITYKGLPAPVISDYLNREESKTRYEPGTQFQIGRIDMVANTGTYLDTPFHRYDNRTDLAELELTSIANLDGIVVRKIDSAERGISAKDLQGVDVNGKAVLFHTGWDQKWRTDAYANGNHSFLMADAAQYLAEAGATLVGIDSFNIDSTADRSRPAHSILLDKNIPIVEHLCGLDQLPDQQFKFFAVPIKIKAFGSFPVRAFAIVPRSAAD